VNLQVALLASAMMPSSVPYAQKQVHLYVHTCPGSMLMLNTGRSSAMRNRNGRDAAPLERNVQRHTAHLQPALYKLHWRQDKAERHPAYGAGRKHVC
jgi:hypothetical protein